MSARVAVAQVRGSRDLAPVADEARKYGRAAAELQLIVRKSCRIGTVSSATGGPICVVHTTGGRRPDRDESLPRLALEHTQVFIPYLNIGVRFQDHLTRARLEPAGVRLLPFDDYFARLLDYALAADWGKRPSPHPRSAAHPRSDQHPAPSTPPPESQPPALPRSSR